ncbi:peptidase S15/CocE/NonD [Diaporthe eres]|nr:peptidase S15/CocE/NonD [Diaporthe eres]
MHLNFPVHATPVGSIKEIPEKQQQSVNYGYPPRVAEAHRSQQEHHPNFPFHPHDRQEPVSKGTVVKLEIGIWALGMDFGAGESISLRVGGQYHSIAEYANWSAPRPEHELNRGQHTVY